MPLVKDTHVPVEGEAPCSLGPGAVTVHLVARGALGRGSQYPRHDHSGGEHADHRALPVGACTHYYPQLAQFEQHFPIMIRYLNGGTQVRIKCGNKTRHIGGLQLACVW